MASLILLEEKFQDLNIIRLLTRDYMLLQRNNFQVEYNPNECNRKTCEELEKEIQNIWEKKKKKSKLYNCSKFRCASFQINEDSFKLYLGITYYKDIIGISQSHNVEKWKSKGEEEFRNKQAFLSNGLGVGILAFTSDDHLILIRRANWVGEYPCFFDRPGGHPEPDNVAEIQGMPEGKDADHSIANEIWKSPIDELVAEIGVSLDQIEDPKLMGITQNLLLAGRPSLEFLTRLKCSAQEVLQLYNLRNHSEAEESTRLYLINSKKLEIIIQNIKKHYEDPDNFEKLTDLTVEMKPENYTPALRGALLLWSKHF